MDFQGVALDTVNAYDFEIFKLLLLSRNLQLILLLTIILLIPLFTFAQIQQKEVRIGLVPEMNVFAQSERFKPLMEYLTKKTGIKFRIKMLRQYGDIVDNFNDLKLDGAFFGSFTAVLVSRNC